MLPNDEGAEPTTSRGTRRSSLDGLRALLVLLIVAFHLGIPHMSQGYVGVDGYLVLSGYLISASLLYHMRKSNDTIEFLPFYARRAQRALPVFLAVLAATLVAVRLIADDEIVFALQSKFMSATLFQENIYLISTEDDLVAVDTNPVAHYWLPAVAAQFYLVFPFFFTKLMAWSQYNRDMGWLFVAMAVNLVVFQYWVADRYSQVFIFCSLILRIYPFLLGAACAVGVGLSRETRANRESRVNIGKLASLAGVAGLLVTALGLYQASMTTLGLVSAVSTAAVIVGTELNDKSPVAEILGSNAMRSMGKAAWSIYLVHYPVIVLAHQWGLDVTEAGRFSLELEVMCVIAVLSWLVYTVVERPANKMKLPYQTVYTAAAVGLIVMLALISVGTTTSMDGMNLPIQTGFGRPSPSPVPSPTPSRTPTRAPTPTPTPTRTPKKAASLFLIGDSYAREWAQSLPVIGLLMKIQINLLSQPGECPWFPSVNEKCNPQQYWNQVLQTPSPRVIFLVTGQIYMEDVAVIHAGRKIARDDSAWPLFMEKSIRRTLDPLLLNESEDNMIIIIQAHSPRPRALEKCLEEKTADECTDIPLRSWGSFPQWKVAYDAMEEIYHRLDKEYGFRLSYVSMDDLIAPQGTVSAMDGPFQLFEDELHLTAGWCTAHSFDFARKIQPYLAAPPA